jgi:hypothetical protein
VSGRVALAAGGVCYVALVLSHPLSPYMVIAGAVLLALVTRRPPAWIPAAMIVLAGLWLALGWDFVSAHFKLLDFSPSTSARGATPAAPGLSGVALGLDLSRAAIVLMAALAVVGFVRRRRAGYWDSLAVGLSVAPALLALGQSYNGEGALRAYLFALPWLSFFAAAACLPGPGGRRSAAAARLLLATGIIGTCTLFGYFGQEPVNYVTSSDVAASRWFLDHAPPGAELVYAAPNFPERVSARYAEHLDAPRSLTDDPALRAALARPTPVAAVRREVAAFLGAHPRHPTYLVVSPSQDRYVRYQAMAPAGALERLMRALTGAPGLTPVFRQDGATIFAWRPG